MARVKRISKVDENIKKTKNHISELQRVLKNLEEEKTKLENTEIVGIIRKEDISIEQLCEIIKQFKLCNSNNIDKEKRQTESDD